MAKQVLLFLVGCAVLIGVMIACAPSRVLPTPTVQIPRHSTMAPRPGITSQTEEPIPPTAAAPATPGPTATGPILLGSTRLDPTQIGTAVPREMPKQVPELVTLGHLREDPSRYRDQLIHIKGLGVIMATIPLCEGHVGPDQRTLFLDPDEDSIVATTAEAAWGDLVHRPGEARLFSGYLRFYRGPVGCPGEASAQTIFYLELLSVR